jgi:DNA-binding MarR family transcriptional regulator
MFLQRHEGPSLSDVAEHLGLTLPSMSKLVDGLVASGVVVRRPHPGDRRRVTLTLSEGGRSTLQAVREATQAHLASMLATLSADQRAVVVEAMQALQEVFAPDRTQVAERVGGRT